MSPCDISRSETLFKENFEYFIVDFLVLHAY